MAHAQASMQPSDLVKRYPLLGKRVLITRATEQAAELQIALLRLGADTVQTPLIAIAPPADWDSLDKALRTVASFDWVIFTSVNAFETVLNRLLALDRDVRVFATCRLVAVGPATARALLQRGLRADLVPARHDASGVLAAMEHLAPGRVLLPQSDRADEALQSGLEHAGFSVTRVQAYRTVHSIEQARLAATLIRNREIDIVTFTSPSTVQSLLQALGSEARELLAYPVIACIGPTTAQALSNVGVIADVVAESHTVDGLVTAIANYEREHHK
jgi:uroporphyrinogen III methyltransferase/synthase